MALFHTPNCLLNSTRRWEVEKSKKEPENYSVPEHKDLSNPGKQLDLIL